MKINEGKKTTTLKWAQNLHKAYFQLLLYTDQVRTSRINNPYLQAEVGRTPPHVSLENFLMTLTCLTLSIGKRHSIETGSRRYSR